MFSEKKAALLFVLCLNGSIISGAVSEDSFAVDLSVKQWTTNTVVLSVDIDCAGREPDFISGYTFSVCHDTEKASLKGCEKGSDVSGDTIRDGTCCSGISAGADMAGLEKFTFHTAGVVEGGFFVAAITDFLGGWGIASGANIQLYELTYDVIDREEATVRICNNEIGTPEKYINSVTYNSEELLITATDEVTVYIPLFLRGDVNNDGIVNLADAIGILTYCFAGGAEPSCQDAADANDDSSINLSDAVTVLSYQFNAAVTTLPEPFKACGPDPTPDHLPECVYEPCN